MNHRRIEIPAKDFNECMDISQQINDNYLAICHAAYSISINLDIKVIVVLTDSGKTAIQMAQFRPHATIVAITPSINVCNQLSIIWGVLPIHKKQPKDIHKLYHMINNIFDMTSASCFCSGAFIFHANVGGRF